MSGFVLGEDEGLNINFRGTKMIIKVSEKDSEGRYSLIVMSHQANSGPALHIHPNSPEAYYVLDGEYTVQFGEKIRHAYAGDFVFIPKGAHTNTSLVQMVETNCHCACWLGKIF